ncbi:OstA-like protein [Prosthecochloris sp. HL-130-GSB]|jgi:lipopolysaccharide export system protein LptA|uniref:Organic solvent tolerance-like N-terminal domain-containing protein n=1 Tax=Prosthecochloris aestuarii TaxID=1102 RepID=A0A831SSZ9_PROAE|nr:OstA-like protein [Prosthecochloris sp. HL-130-GSB]ARM30148.1 hypothetical protein B9H02_00890 [Prosthecochloris sp. HL-130-GSB]MBO8091732.1 hypothetical protein [Prosthecochloris sp.]HED31202.1 hypothetical protein [Prosthecochloris aestuarii]
MNAPAKLSSLFLCAIMLSLCSGVTNNTAYAEKKKIILRQATTLSGGEARSPISGQTEPVRKVAGNVIFQHGTTELRCSAATEFLESGVIELRGPVRITGSAFEILGDSGLYYPQLRRGTLAGNVRSRSAENRLVARGNRATIHDQGETVDLTGDAIAWHELKQLSGDTITVRLDGPERNRKISSITSRGRAFLALPDTVDTSSGLYHQLRGKHMLISMGTSSDLKSIDVHEQAEMLYFTYEGREPSGINYTSGKRIFLNFTEGSLSTVTAYRNVSGKQFPASMRNDRKLDLPGFLIREHEKPSF